MPQDPQGLGKLLLYNGSGWISKAIEWQTCARGDDKYSHAALLYPDGNTVIESYQGAGVRTRRFDDPAFDSSLVDAFDVKGMTALQWACALKYAEGELGCGYDYRGIIRFITRKDGGDPTRWWCSELAFAAIANIGIALLRANPWQVDPARLGISPLITRAYRKQPKGYIS